MVEKACRKCMRIIDSYDNECKLCESSDLTSEWGGLVIILNPSCSIISNKMNLDIKIPSKFALRVR